MTQDHIFSAYYHLIVIDGCSFCEKAVALLNETGELFHTENATGKKNWLKEQKENYSWKTVPIVNKVQIQNDGSIDVEFVGGYTDLREHMNVGAENTTKATEKEEAATDST